MNGQVTVQVQILGTFVGALAPAGSQAPQITIDFTVSATPLEVDQGFIRANVQALFMLSDQTVTIKTNSSGAPDDTFTLTANEPLLLGLAHSVPQGTGTVASLLTHADVTKFFIVNGSGNAGTFRYMALIT